jgi:hypothetical protein
MTQVDLDETGRALIEMTREAYEPSAANRVRVRWRVAHQLAAERSPSGCARRRRVAPIVTWSVAALAVGTAAALAWQGARREPAAYTRSLPAAPVEPASAASNVAAAPALPKHAEGPAAPAASEAAQAAAPAGVPSRPARPATRGSHAQAGDADLADEVALIARAQAATNRGQAERALEALREYDRRHPEGALTQERSAARILALCAAGKPAQARAEAERFRARWPGSPQAARIQSSCAGR